MFYFEVLVGDMQFHGSAALTYEWDKKLQHGQVVRIALKNRSVLGIILSEVPQPSFKTKSISAVADGPPMPIEALKLLHWMQDYYPAPFGTVVRQFMPPTVTFPKKITLTKTIARELHLPKLTNEQQQVINAISRTGSYLLHGVTGSGKTRVYLELTKKTLAENRSIVILTPEIGLTESLVQAFSVFSVPIFVLHSRLTNAARRDIWYEILRCQSPCIIIGPRSALFTPVHNVGLIVIDESHDQAYKSDSQPRYRTERVAAMLSHYHKAIFIRGSATPNIEDVYLFEQKKLPILYMNKKAKDFNDSQDKTSIVDMRDGTNFGRSRIISNQLLRAISRAMANGEQSLLFLNRRGTAGVVLCTACGWRATCSHCDLPLTYHGDAHILQCHVCGRHQPLQPNCPECRNVDILYKSIGTKAVVEEVSRLFPTGRIKRFDTDTTKGEQIEHQLQTLLSGDIDIIVGTQMITKGLDLPKLSVVGILNADSSLLIPDYTAQERTFQLVNQVVGRVGRGHRSATVVLQTYDTENPLFPAALSSNWNEFYQHEIEERQRFNFPPFVYLLKLWCLRATPISSEKTATKLAHDLTIKYPNLHFEGPSPSFHPKESGKYKWQIVVKSTSRKALIQIVGDLPSGWNYDIDPTNLL